MDEEKFTPKPKRKKPVRETGRGGIEQTGRKYVAAHGGISLKWTSPGRSGVPDQIELYGIQQMIARGHQMDIFLTEEEARDLLAAAVQFTEYKRPKKEPTPVQLENHRMLRGRGFTVNVVDYMRKAAP